MTLPALLARPALPLAGGASESRRALTAAFFAGRNARTLDAYGRDLADFREFLAGAGVQTRDLDDAAGCLLRGGHGTANAIALAYRAHLLERHLAPATINRRLAALRSLVKLARTLGLVPWALEVASVESAPYRDTRGPGTAGVRQVLAALDGHTDPKGLRDRAIVRLLYDRGLRRAEVVALDVDHVNLELGSVAVLGKGRTERVWYTLPPKTVDAVRAWLAARGGAPGPLFVNLSPARKTAAERLTGRSLHRNLGQLGERAGVAGRVRPHGIRHTAITDVLAKSNGNVVEAQKFSRHRDVKVLLVYNDNRADVGGRLAALIADDV